MGELWLGGGLQGDFPAEGFEPADEVTLAVFGVVALGEVIAAEVVVVDVAVQQVPGDGQDGVADGEGGFGFSLGAEAAQEVAVLGWEVAVLGAGGGPGGFA